MSFLINCCKEQSITSKFESVYMKLTKNSWNNKSQDAINQLLVILRQPTIEAKNGLQLMFNSMNTNEQPSFNLINLLILDQIVDQLKHLDKIRDYKNIFISSIDNSNASYIHLFISNYYQYIKDKTQLYLLYGETIFYPQDISKPITSEQQHTTLNIIQGFINLHRFITQANLLFQKLTQIYRQLDLLSQIILWMLKNHLRTYRTISACFYYFLNIDNQKFTPLILAQLRHCISRFNKEYIKHLREFISSNIKIKVLHTLLQEFQEFSTFEIKQIPNDFLKIMESMQPYLVPSSFNFLNTKQNSQKSRKSSDASIPEIKMNFTDPNVPYIPKELVSDNIFQQRPHSSAEQEKQNSNVSGFMLQSQLFLKKLRTPSILSPRSKSNNQQQSPSVQDLTPIFYDRQSPDKKEENEDQSKTNTQIYDSVMKLDQSVEFQPEYRQHCKDNQQNNIKHKEDLVYIEPQLKQSFRNYFYKVQSELKLQ